MIIKGFFFYFFFSMEDPKVAQEAQSDSFVLEYFTFVAERAEKSKTIKLSMQKW